MSDSALVSVGLPIALTIIMFGLGLSRAVGDFRRAARAPHAGDWNRRTDDEIFWGYSGPSKSTSACCFS